MYSEVKPSQNKLSFIKQDQSMRDEFKKQMQLKNTLLDDEFYCLEQGQKYEIKNESKGSGLQFKQELNAIAQSNYEKVQLLNDIMRNRDKFLSGEMQDEQKHIEKKIVGIKLLQMQQNHITIEDNLKRSFFHSPDKDKDAITPNINQTHSIYAEHQGEQRNLNQKGNQDTLKVGHKDSQLVDQLRIRVNNIGEKINAVEQEAIFENSTSDQLKFKTKKYLTIITEIKKKIQELHALNQMADNRYSNTMQHMTLSKQQMQMAVSNLNLNRDQIKIMKETEEETLQFKQDTYDLEKQSLQNEKKRTCELLMKIDILTQQEKNQVEAIENLEYRQMVLFEQKQTSSYVEQNIDTLTKLCEIFIEKKFYLMDEVWDRSISLIGQSSPMVGNKRISKVPTFFNKQLFNKPQISIEDIDAHTPTNRSSLNYSPLHSRRISQEPTKQTKKELLFLKQNSIKSERSRKIDKVNKFSEFDSDQLSQNLIQVYSNMVFENGSLQSQFEYLQKSKIQQNLELRQLEQQLTEGWQYTQQKTDNQQNGDVQQKSIFNKEWQQNERLIIEVDKMNEIKGEQDRILLNSLYFLIQTIKKHKRLIDEVNDKGEVELANEEYESLDKIDQLLDRYSKGFMQKKLFESFQNRKKYLQNTSITSCHTHLSILLPKDPKNSSELLAQQTDSFLSKERFFFFKELHNYFPLTVKELKQTLKLIFPKSFNEGAIELILDVSSKDILNGFFLSKDDLINIGEQCFNTFEYFKQFNMILTHHEQLKYYAKQSNVIPLSKMHGSRRLSQYSPLKNPIYILQKGDNSNKAKKDFSSGLKLDLQAVNVVESEMHFPFDKSSSPKLNINQIEFNGQDTAKSKIVVLSSPKYSQSSINESQLSNQDELNNSNGTSLSSFCSLESHKNNNFEDYIKTKQSKKKYLKVITQQISPQNSDKQIDVNDELDQEEKEEQAQQIKKQEQIVLGEFMLMQLQKKSIKNLFNIIKQIISSEQDIFKYLQSQKAKYEKISSEQKKLKPEQLKFNEQQIQAYINQAEKTLQYKKQREQLLNDKLQKNTEDQFDDDDDYDEDEFENINQWKNNISSHFIADQSQKSRSQFSGMLSQRNFERRKIYDSFVSEESCVLSHNEFFQQKIQKKSQTNVHKLDQQKNQQWQQEQLIKAKELIIKLSEQNKDKDQYKNFNQNLKFKKLGQEDQTAENEQKTNKQSTKANKNQAKLKAILIQQKENTITQIQAFREQKKNKNNQEREYIEVQRKGIKKERNDINNGQKSTSQLEDQAQIIQPPPYEAINDRIHNAEYIFQSNIAKEDRNQLDLLNQGYYIDNLKTFHNDAFFLQKLHILGKSKNIPFYKKNKSMDLPIGLHQTKYFEKVKAYEKQQYMAMSQQIQPNETQRMRENSQKKNPNNNEKEQNDRVKVQHHNSKSIQISAVYNKSLSQSKIDGLILDSKNHLDLIKRQFNSPDIISSNQSNQLLKKSDKISLKYVEQLNKENLQKDHMITEKVQQKIDTTSEIIKSKNMKSLCQLKQIFNIDQDLNKRKKQQSQNSTYNSAFQSIKNSGGSFQSQLSNYVVSQTPSVSNSNSVIKTNSYPINHDYIINSSKTSSSTSFVISPSLLRDIPILSEQKAIQNILPQPSPYSEQYLLNPQKVFHSVNASHKKHLTKE